MRPSPRSERDTSPPVAVPTTAPLAFSAIDRATVARRPIGATAWTIAKDREYDDQDENKKDSQPESLAKILLERMGLANVKPKPPSEEDEGDQEEELSEPDTSFT